MVRETISKIAPLELEYRGLGRNNLQAVLDDIYRTAELVCTGVYTKDQSFEFKELMGGVRRIRDLIISENFNQYSAIVAASKAAYLSLLLGEGIDTFNQFDSTVDLRNVRLESPINPVVNKIKSIKPEAFWYWREIEKLLTR